MFAKENIYFPDYFSPMTFWYKVSRASFDYKSPHLRKHKTMQIYISLDDFLFPFCYSYVCKLNCNWSFNIHSYLDEFVRVKSVYSEEEFEELTLQIGDIVKVENRLSSGWLWVNHNQSKGWYPESYLEDYNSKLEEGKRKI